MTQNERGELIELAVVRYRCGDIGPLTLREELRRCGVADDLISRWRDYYGPAGAAELERQQEQELKS